MQGDGQFLFFFYHLCESQTTETISLSPNTKITMVKGMAIGKSLWRNFTDNTKQTKQMNL